MVASWRYIKSASQSNMLMSMTSVLQSTLFLLQMKRLRIRTNSSKRVWSLPWLRQQLQFQNITVSGITHGWPTILKGYVRGLMQRMSHFWPRLDQLIASVFLQRTVSFLHQLKKSLMNWTDRRFSGSFRFWNTIEMYFMPKLRTAMRSSLFLQLSM